ncbi:phosphatidylcholine transfer protein isoform X3 [Rhinoderma darwinii]|uniref:phosphatidylcholine transfer protein isoform X3 n=1 Tax=Rhinoderma darwinii TaxID=43563 RepID=UPI003F664D69
MEIGFIEEQFQEAWRELDERALPAGWELFTESMGIQIYRLYDEKTGLYEYKIYGGLADCPPELCADVYMDLDYRKKWDQYVKVFMYYFDNPGGMIPSWLINWAAKVHHGKTEHSNKTQGSYAASARPLPGKDFKQTGVSKCAVQALLKKHQETGNVEDRRCSGRPRKRSASDQTHQAYFPSKSEDVQQCHQLRTGRNQWDPGTPIYSLGMSDQKWSSWKNYGQKAVPLTWKQG